MAALARAKEIIEKFKGFEENIEWRISQKSLPSLTPEDYTRSYEAWKRLDDEYLILFKDFSESTEVIAVLKRLKHASDQVKKAFKKIEATIPEFKKFEEEPVVEKKEEIPEEEIQVVEEK